MPLCPPVAHSALSQSEYAALYREYLLACKDVAAVCGAVVGDSRVGAPRILAFGGVHAVEGAADGNASAGSRAPWWPFPVCDVAALEGSVDAGGVRAARDRGARGVGVEQVGVVGADAERSGTVVGGSGEKSVRGDERGCGGEMASSDVSEKTLANRAKRQKRKAAKLRKQQAASSVSSTSKRDESDVPEWRRQNVRATFHKGAFADCSADVQKELRETRARMLVEKNKTAVVEAEHRRRTMEARLRSRLIEEEVENKRLAAEAEYKKLAEQRMKDMPQGFAETIVSNGLSSVISVPSLDGSGSVSPNSSVSVAMVRRMEATIVDLTKKLSLMSEKVMQTETKLQPGQATTEQFRRPAARSTKIGSKTATGMRIAGNGELMSKWEIDDESQYYNPVRSDFTPV